MARKKSLITRDVLQCIREAAERGDYEVNLQGLTFEDFELHDMEIPINLNCKGSTFNGPINLCRSRFNGVYINLDEAKIRKGFFFNGLKTQKRGYSVYLKNAEVWGRMELQDTVLDWIVTDGMKCHPGEQGRMGTISLTGTVFERGGIGIKER